MKKATRRISRIFENYDNLGNRMNLGMKILRLFFCCAAMFIFSGCLVTEHYMTKNIGIVQQRVYNHRIISVTNSVVNVDYSLDEYLQLAIGGWKSTEVKHSVISGNTLRKPTETRLLFLHITTNAVQKGIVKDGVWFYDWKDIKLKYDSSYWNVYNDDCLTEVNEKEAHALMTQPFVVNEFHDKKIGMFCVPVKRRIIQHNLVVINVVKPNIANLDWMVPMSILGGGESFNWERKEDSVCVTFSKVLAFPFSFVVDTILFPFEAFVVVFCVPHFHM